MSVFLNDGFGTQRIRPALRGLCIFALSLIALSKAIAEEPALAPSSPAFNTTKYEPLPTVLATATSGGVTTNAPAIDWNMPGSGMGGSAMVTGLSGPVAGLLISSNKPGKLSANEKSQQAKLLLEQARFLRNSRRTPEAVPLLIGLLGEDSPDKIQRSALLELAAAAQEENELSRAQQIYAQFLYRWPDDPRAPEVLLRQGQVFRQMGLNNLALTKFYAVMTGALSVKNDRLDYYAAVVLQAQMEIAETHYLLGKYVEATDFFGRLLKQNNPPLDKPTILYKLLRCQSAITNYDGAVATGQDFLNLYPNAPEEPEVRFYLALALKELGRNNESLQQVLTLLREQNVHSQDRPEIWAYWQQRTGNLIANQLYREGDYMRALDIYLGLASLDDSPAWQVPVNYQIGMTYERLWQPEKAIDIYDKIIKREAEINADHPSPSLTSIVDMARWRINFIHWQSQAEASNHAVHSATAAPLPPTALLTKTPTP